MILYRPVLIESAEQAEALPIGTVATDLGSTIISAAVRTDVGLGWFVSGDEMTDMHEHLVGWTALVPIEAEERIGSEMCHQITDKRYDIHVLPAGDEKQARWQIENNPDYATGRIMRQYRTPWEEAQ